MIFMEQLRRVLRSALPLSVFSAGVAWLVVPPSSSSAPGSSESAAAAAAMAAPGRFLPFVATGGSGGMDPGAFGGVWRGGPAMIPRVSEVTPQTRDAILNTITAQNAALQKGNLRAALRLATADFRTSQTMEGFGQMVRGQFPQLLTARRTTCQAMECFDQRYARALVQVRGSSPNDTALFRYYLAREGGRWRVSGIYPFVSGAPAGAAPPVPAAAPSQ
jgi:hypothetical protein